MNTGIQASAAAYVASAPQGCGRAPTVTRPQLLPLGSVNPKDFERLCYRVTRLEATVEECRLFGVNGQSQDGIDLYARLRDGSYRVVQCKRSSGDFPPAKITAAVDVFLQGEWAKNCATFVLAITANLEQTQAADRIEQERGRLAERGIAFEVWDETALSAVLKDQPRLVDDFFGREAVRVFCGEQAADELGQRLDASEVVEYRAGLLRLYQEVFRGLERGVHSDRADVTLEDRFVVPDVLVTEPGRLVGPAAVPGPPAHADPAASRQEWSVRDTPVSAARAPAAATGYAERVPVLDWLATGSQHLVVGVPGAGKSALLRRLVLDMLADEPELVGGVDRLHGVLPLWLPFAYWTNAARQDRRCASVLGAVESWLDAYDHGHLWPLVRKALEDDRLLLVVDGLDEWASPDAARLCLNRLEVFCSTKRLAAVASSRPFSAAEVPVDAGRWRTAALAPLDGRQRREFIAKWLAPLMDSALAKRETARWAAEVESSAHLAELADLPLFLSLLLRSREQRTEFPEDLHAVLGEVVARLIGEHRRRKIDTSGTTDVFPTTGDIRKVSAATAEHMHRQSVITIGDDVLREVFKGALTDLIGYPPGEAHAIAGLLVNALSPGMGLMVRPAPDETQFFHRSVLEFLAAERLLASTSNEQITLFQEHVADRRWQQVLRFMLRGLARPAEIAAIFDALNAAAAGSQLLQEAVDLLAAEVAVGTGALDAPLRRRLLERATGEIETGERAMHRARLVESLVPGLARRELRTSLAERCQAWLRACDTTMWSATLRAAEAWEADSTLLEMLWHGLLSDDDEVQRTAGRVLGRSFSGDTTVAARLTHLAATTRSWGRRAAATEALSMGWPDHEALDVLIDSGRTHPHHAVRHACVAADLRRGHRSDDNRDALMQLFDHTRRLSAWTDGVTELLVEFFPDDDIVFDRYVRDADATDESHFRYDKAPVIGLVLGSFSARPAARRYFLQLLSPRGLFPANVTLLVDRIPWQAVPDSWHSDPEIVTAVERLVAELATSPIGNPQLYQCSRVARTDAVRDALLDRLDADREWHLGWIIRALLEGWPRDPAVTEALGRLVSAEPARTSAAAISFLDRVVADPDTAMRLLDALASVTEHHDAVLECLNALLQNAVERDDPRVAPIVERALAAGLARPGSRTEELLYSRFSDRPAVRERALARLADHDAPLAAIAYGFRDDATVRTALAGRMHALGAPLRARLVEALAARPASDTEATDLLLRSIGDPDQTVAILASAAFARRHKHAGTVTDDVVSLFTAHARARGLDNDRRRAAAFCALAELGRLDVLTDLTETSRPGERVVIRHSYVGDRSLLYRYVCRFWPDVKAALGDNPAARFGHHGSSDTEFWREILQVAHDYPATHHDLTALLDKRPELAATSAGISFLSRSQNPSQQLWTATLKVLCSSHALSYNEVQPAWTALHVLAGVFDGDPRITAWLDRLDNEPALPAEEDEPGLLYLPSHGEIAALARFRTEHPFITSFLDEVSPGNQIQWAEFLAWTELAAARAGTPSEFADVAHEISRIIDRNDEFPDYIHQPLTARLRRDDDLAADLTALVPDLPTFQRGIIMRLLGMSGRLTDTLTHYLHETHTHLPSPEATFDPLTGHVTDLQLLTLDVLDTAERQQA